MATKRNLTTPLAFMSTVSAIEARRYRYYAFGSGPAYRRLGTSRHASGIGRSASATGISRSDRVTRCEEDNWNCLGRCLCRPEPRGSLAQQSLPLGD